MKKHGVAALLAASLLSLPVMAQSVDVAGVKYESSVDLGGQKLQLNGAGIRYKAVFKVYTAGLYTNGATSSPEAVMANTGPKRLHIQMLREIDGNELGKLFTKGIEQNATREEFAKSINGIMRIADVFSTRQKLSSGDHFSVDFIPGTGTRVLVNGKPTGDVIKEPEFYNVFLKIWLGKSPADEQLKEALLGVKRERAGRS